MAAVEGHVLDDPPRQVGERLLAVACDGRHTEDAGLTLGEGGSGPGAVVVESRSRW